MKQLFPTRTQKASQLSSVYGILFKKNYWMLGPWAPVVTSVPFTNSQPACPRVFCPSSTTCAPAGWSIIKAHLLFSACCFCHWCKWYKLT